MKLVTAAFEFVQSLCKKIQRAAARGKSLAYEIADAVGASQTVMREIVEHPRQNGSGSKSLDDAGTASHRHNPGEDPMRGARGNLHRHQYPVRQ